MFQKANMIVLKVTRDCNFKCKYCYLGDYKYPDSYMSFETFQLLVNKVVNERIKYQNKSVIKFVFHGGEPLLTKIEDLSKMIQYLKDKGKIIPIDIGIQTNLSLLNEEYLSLLTSNNIDFGLSYDGLGNEGRSDTFKRKDYDKKIKMIYDKGIPVSFLMVINKNNINKIKKTIKYLYKKFKVTDYKMNYVIDIFGNQSIEVTGKEYFNKVTKYFIDNIDKKFNDSNVNHLIEKYFTEVLFKDSDFFNRENCSTMFCGAGLNIIEIEPNGNILFCGRYSKETEDNTLCHIKDSQFLDLNYQSKIINYAYKKHEIIKKVKCDICIAKNICDFGCMAFHYSRYGEYGIQTYLVCDLFKITYKYLQDNEYKILEKLFLKNNKRLKIKSQGNGRRLNHNRFSVKKLINKYKINFGYSKNNNEFIFE